MTCAGGKGSKLASRSACLALAVGNYEKEREAAKERQRGGQGGVLLLAHVPEATKGDARDKTAERFGVGGRTLQRAAFIEKRAVLWDAMWDASRSGRPGH